VSETKDVLKTARGAIEEEHVARWQHNCPSHGWETCAVAASLLDAHNPTAEHACVKPLGVRYIPTFTCITREIPA